MHAHLCRPDEDAVDRLTSGSQAFCLLEPRNGDRVLLLTLWPDESGARSADALSPGRVLEVEDVLGQAGSGPARLASTTEFDGPRDARQVDADRRANRERIWPAAASVPGTLGAVVLRGPDGAMVVVALAEHEAAMAGAPRAILSTPLLPGEDPALLQGPDRFGEHRLRDGGVADLIAAAAVAGAAR